MYHLELEQVVSIHTEVSDIPHKRLFMTVRI